MIQVISAKYLVYFDIIYKDNSKEMECAQSQLRESSKIPVAVKKHEKAILEGFI